MVTVVFSDASEEPPQPPSVWPSGKLAFIVFKPNGAIVYDKTIVPSEMFQLIDNLRARKNHICTLETMALIAVKINPSLQDDLRGADVNHFGTIPRQMEHPLRDIHQRQTSLGAYHLRITQLGARIWIEYVPSAANIADMPSRGNFKVIERVGANFKVIESIGAKRIQFTFPSLASWGDMQ